MHLWPLNNHIGITRCRWRCRGARRLGMSSRVARRRTTSRCRSKGRLNCPTIICTQDLGRTCDQVRCYGACEPLRIQRIVLSQLAIEHLHARTNPLHDKEQFVIQGGCYARPVPSYAHGSASAVGSTPLLCCRIISRRISDTSFGTFDDGPNDWITSRDTGLEKLDSY